MSEAKTEGSRDQEALQAIPRDMVNGLFSLLKNLSVHGIDNSALDRPVEAFLMTVRKAGNDREFIEVSYVDGALLINERKVEPHFSIVEAMKVVPDHMEVATFESLKFSSKISKEQIGTFFSKWALHASVHGKPHKLSFEDDFIEIKYVDPEKAAGAMKTKEMLMNPTHSLRHYYYLRKLTDEFFQGFSTGDIKPQRALRRELLEISDIIDVAAYQAVAMTLIRENQPEQNLPHHISASVVSQAVSTAVLSMVLGKELGYGTRERINLGLLGLMYNIGLIGEASVLIAKEDRLSPHEYKKVIDAQASGVFKLIQTQGSSRPVLERLLAIFENAHGQKKESISLNLESRLLSLVSQYVALTNPRPFRDAYMPDEAVKLLGSKATLKKQGGLDPILFYVFIRFMGYLPVGSFVELSDGRKGVLYRPSGEQVGTPLVKIKPERAEGRSFLTDLSTEANLSIVRCMDPDREGVKISGYFFE